MGGREGLVDTAVKTATTGYIQRRQMKAMEDNRVCYDGTVRNAQGAVVQFIYGGDGNDPCRLEKLQLKCITESKQNLEKFLLDKTPTKIQEEELEILLKLSKEIRNGRSCALSASLDNTVLLPINFSRMLQGWHTSNDEAISEEDCFNQVQSLIQEMEENKRGNILCVKTAVSYFLCTKNIRKHEISSNEMRELCKKIIGRNIAAACSAGEMVGSIAAQSLGEPCTQMSSCYYTPVLVAIDGKTQSTYIGELIDQYMPEIKSDQQHDVMKIEKLKCLGASATEKVTWANVTHISRHPANGDMITVKTEKGRELKMTASHSFLVRQDNKIVPKIGADLVVGEALPIVKNLPSNTEAILPASPVKLTRAAGRYIGLVVSEGCVGKENVNNNINCCNTDAEWMTRICDDFAFESGLQIRTRKKFQSGLGSLPMVECNICSAEFTNWLRENFGRISQNKTLPAWIIDAPQEFAEGLLQTYYDGDGCITIEPRHHAIRAHSVSHELITMISLCLARFGIPSYIGEEKYKTPAGKPGINYRINIPMCFVDKFKEHIGFSLPEKRKRLDEVLELQKNENYRGIQAHIPGMNSILEAIREYIPRGGNKNSYETLLRKEYRRIQRKAGITPKMLERVKTQALRFNAPYHLIAELDQAINADVWWDKIESIEIERDSKEMVYDFTVDVNLQSFMLSNGVFVHNTLNTFHSAGIGSKNVTLGIPRLKEILDFTRKIRTPSNTIRFKAPFCYKADFAENLASGLPNLKLCDVVERMELLYDPDFEKTTIDNDQLMITIDSYYSNIPASSSKWVARLSLSKPEIKRYHLDPPKLGSIIRERISDKVHVITSEVNSLEWWIRFRYYDMNQMIVQGFGESKDMQQNLAHRVTLMLMDQIQLTGHPQIQSANVHELEVWNESLSKNEKQYTVLARGNVLDSISCIDCVDWHNTVTNDVTEALELFGIEAAAAIIYQEIKATVSFDGTYVDSRHLMMVADTMTYRGFVMPISRHGINRTNTGPLVRCSFEETADVLYDAAMFGESDDARGVTQNIMTGQMTNLGTGSFDLFMPDWSLPREGHIKERQTKLVKSRVRKRTNVLEKAPDTLEYVDMNAWNGSGNETQIDLPFVEGESATDSVQNRQYATVDKNTREGEAPLTYKPSSPKLVITKY